MGNTLQVNQNIVFGEKVKENFITKYIQTQTTYSEDKNTIADLPVISAIDRLLCSDLLGLRFGITLKFPALPFSLSSFDVFLTVPTLSCTPSITLSL